MNVTLKKVKVIQSLSEETTCYTADVYIDGVKVAEASNRGQGGPDDYRVLDRERWAKFQAWVVTLPPMQCEFLEGGLSMNDELYIGQLVDQYQEKVWLKRQCKKATLFRLKGDKKDDWKTIESPFNEKVKAFLVNKYGDQIETIANEAIAA